MSKLCVVVCGCFFLLLKGTSTLELKSYSACYGILFENFLQPTCSTGEKIAVVGLTALAKELSTSCPIQVTTPNTVPETCCQYNSIDCSIRYVGDTYRGYYQKCNGNEGCTIQVSWVVTTCNQTIYLARTNYMKLDYYCISNQGLDPCSSLNTKDSQVFLWNPGYPSSPLTGSTACTCSIEASCDSTVRLTALDLRLGSSTACDQSITITDGSTVMVFDCTDNNDYLPITLYVSTSHFIQIQITNNLGSDDGYYSILLEGTSPGAELTLACASTAQSTPVVPSTSLPVCPSTDITTESTTPPPETTTEDKFSSAVPTSSVKSTTVESDTTTTTSVIRTDSSTVDVITVVSTTGGKTITVGTGTEISSSRASENTMTTISGTKGTAETVTKLNTGTTNEITRQSGMSTKGTISMISNLTDDTNSQPTTTKTTTNISITEPIFVSLGWTSTEKDISANVTFTTLSSVSESLQTTSAGVHEQTTQTNVTDTDKEEASPTNSKSTIIGVSIVLIVICALVMVFFLHRDKIKEKCCKKKISVETNEDVNPLYHTIFDENFNIGNRAKPLQLPPLMHRLREGSQQTFNEKEKKKSKKTKSELANTQIPKEQYEGSGIVADKSNRPKKKKKKKKLSQILKDSEPEYTPKPRSYGKSTFSRDIGNFLADVDVNQRFRRTSIIDITDPQGHLEKSVEINTIVDVKPLDVSSNV